MGISLAGQTRNFVVSLGMGAAFGFLYDCFRFLRLLWPSSSLFVFLQDLAYFLLCAGLTFSFMVTENQGEVRFFIVIGELLGLCFYWVTAGPSVRRASRKTAKGVRRTSRWTFRHMVQPVLRFLRRLFRGLAKILLWPFSTVKKVVLRLKFVLKRQSLLLYNLLVPRTFSKKEGRRRKFFRGRQEQGCGQTEKG